MCTRPTCRGILCDGIRKKNIFQTEVFFPPIYKLLKKYVYLEVCKFEKKILPVWKYFFANTIAWNITTGMSCANLKVVVCFLSEISSRGAKVQLKMHENIINFIALPLCLPKGDSRGLSICHSRYLAEQNDTKKKLWYFFFPGLTKNLSSPTSLYRFARLMTRGTTNMGNFGNKTHERLLMS